MIAFMEPALVPNSKDVSENKDLAALSYVWILSLVVLFARRESPFIQFHAKQGAVLFVASVLVWFIPFLGKALELVILALCVLGFLHAAQGQWKEIPVIGPAARGSIADLRKSWKDVVAAFAALWHRVRRQPTESAPAQPAPAPTPAQTAPPVPIAQPPTAPVQEVPMTIPAVGAVSVMAGPEPVAEVDPIDVTDEPLETEPMPSIGAETSPEVIVAPEVPASDAPDASPVDSPSSPSI